MKHGCFIAAAILALLATGCRQTGQNHQLLFREMRLLEDQIYSLEDEVVRLEAELASARRENDSLREELGDGASTRPARPSGRSAAPEGPDVRLPSQPSRRDETGEAPPFSPGVPVPDVTPPAEMRQEPVSAPQGAAEDPNVTAITLHRLLTGGFNNDGRPGDDGVLVVLEPRNARRQIVRMSGPVTIAVTDPARGAVGRVAQWNFTAAELAERFQRTPMGEGYFLELPWPNRPPDGRKLDLLATYRTPRGKELLAEKSITVEPSGSRFAEWSHPVSRTDRPTSVRQASAASRDTRPDLSAPENERPQWSPYR